MPKVNKWIISIQKLIHPSTCLLCGAPGQDNLDLCRCCYQDLPWIVHACLRCGIPLPVGDSLCGHCLKHPPVLDRTQVLWRYTPPVSGLISALKFRGRLPCARLLGELMALRLKDGPKPDCLLPIPLHPRRYRERGFNQAIEIGHPVSQRLDIPLRPRLCQRIRATPPQHELDASMRRSNLVGAFKASHAVKGLNLALIDDVMTTGTTVREVASTLKQAGAARVEAWVLARA